MEPWGNTEDAVDNSREPCAAEAHGGVPTKEGVGARANIGDGAGKNNEVEEGEAKCDDRNTAAVAEPNQVEALE